MADTAVDTSAIAEEVISTFKTLKVEAKKVKTLEAAKEFIPAVVTAVESLGLGKLDGAQKKEVAVKVLNELVNIPGIPEWGEAIVISSVIDGVVAALNKFIGKVWLEKAASALGL